MSTSGSDSGFTTDCVADVTAKSAIACLPDDVVDLAATDDNNSDCDSSNDDYSAELHEAGRDDLYGAAAEPGSTREKWKWANETFVKPCQLLSKLSGFANLTLLYSIFCCLAVSSASAERALSKLKIVKNRLRSSLCDDMLSALLVLASEKDS